MISSFRLTKATCLYLLDLYQHLRQLNILSLHTISIMSCDILTLSYNGFHFIWLIVHSTSLYLIIVLLLILYTQVLLRVQFLALFFSPCILSLCQPLLTRSIMHHSYADDLQLQMLAPRQNILATSPYAFMHMRFLSIGNCEHA